MDQIYEKSFAEKRAFPGGLKEIEHLYDVGRGQASLLLQQYYSSTRARIGKAVPEMC